MMHEKRTEEERKEKEKKQHAKAEVKSVCFQMQCMTSSGRM